MDSETTGLRLAFLLGRLMSGGAELQMIALARGLSRQGYRVDFVCRSGVGPLDDRARAAGARVLPIGELSSSAVAVRSRYARRAAKHLRWITAARRERYDIVDAWLHPNDVFASLTRPLTGIPVVAAGRRNMRPRPRVGPATRPLYSVVNRLTDVVVANAQITATFAIREERVPPSRVRVIRAGVELHRRLTQTERQAQRAVLGASDEDILIGSVGNFRPMKRRDLLISAFSRLLSDHEHLRLVLVGDGELRPVIERQIQDMGLERFVVLTGTATDPSPLYAAFDLFVQASNSESLPNVVLEASAASLPIVATAAGGTGEVIRDGQTGILVPIDDLDQLTAAMRRAICDAGLRSRLGSAARGFVEREYGMERFVREYADLYRELLAAKRGSPAGVGA